MVIHQGQYVTPGSNPVLFNQLIAENTVRGAYHQQQLQRCLHGAIAYSPSTLQPAWSWAHARQEEAERTALAACPHPDARVLVSGWNTYLALAVSRAGYGWSWDNSVNAARRRARDECRKWGEPHFELLLDTRRGQL